MESLKAFRMWGALSLIMVSIVAQAQEGGEWSREARWELFGVVQFLKGDSTTFSNFSGETEIDDTTTIGIGFGYNINNYFNINGELFGGKTDFIGRVSSQTITAETDIAGYAVNIDLNMLERPLTPFVTAGIGSFNFSGDVRGAEFDETDFSYNIGVGARWDAMEHLLLKVLYRAAWTELEDTEDKVRLDGINLNVGYRF